LKTISPELAARLAKIVGRDHCLTDEVQLRTYESDGLTSFRATPGVVVLPGSTEEVVSVVKLASSAGAPIVSLRGSHLPPGEGLR